MGLVGIKNPSIWLGKIHGSLLDSRDPAGFTGSCWIHGILLDSWEPAGGRCRSDALAGGVSALVDEVVDSLCEFDVKGRDAGDGVGGESEGDLGVFDQDVGVMLCLFGNFTDVVDEIDAVHEFFELEVTSDEFFFGFPLWAFLQGGVQIVFF